MGEYNFEVPEIGLQRCQREFLRKPQFRGNRNSAIMDKVARERAKLSEIPGVKGKAKYIAVRYLPIEVIQRLKAVLTPRR